MNNAAIALTVVHPLFQEDEGGSIPTSPLQLKIRSIGHDAAKVAYVRWHYLRGREFFSTYNFGAYCGRAFLGAISFGPPNAKVIRGLFTPDRQFGWLEITRLAMSPDCGKNSESRFIAISIRLLRRTAVVRGILAYADDGAGHVGTIYKASGFESHGLTSPKKDYYDHDEIVWRGKVSGRDGEWRERSRKWLYVKRYPQDVAA